MKLSIVVVTMNRATQLIDALRSCINCVIPSDTQFVIIDNASTDNTEQLVLNFFKEYNYEYYYEKLPRNIGCGNGRNYAYLKSKGDYVYFLDDDAYIDTSSNNLFFIKAIEIFDNFSEIKTLTTQIYDLMWKKNRVELTGARISENLFKCFLFCGGSHFLRRDFFAENQPYYPNKYGYEEILPSFMVYDSGYLNAFASDLNVIHNPKIDKWDNNKEDGVKLHALGFSQNFLLRFSLYPTFIKPLNFVAFCVRLYRFRSWAVARETVRMVCDIPVDRKVHRPIKYSTVKRLYREFGFSIF